MKTNAISLQTMSKDGTSRKRKAPEAALKDLIDETLLNLSNRRIKERTEKSKESVEAIADKFAPPTLKDAFVNLYRALSPCLVDCQSNTSAIVQGPRGSGKTLLVDSVLATITSGFRKVRIHGRLLGNVADVVREMLRQLSPENSKYKILQGKSHLFVNNIQLLNEVLEIAYQDGLPICVVLEDLDAFVGDQNTRQVLLYHLLDRVASGENSLLSIVGITSHSAPLSQLEKRIQSRAMSSTVFIHLQVPRSINQWKDILSDYIPEPLWSEESWNKVAKTLKRELQLARSVQWLLRVWSIALCRFRYDVVEKGQAEKPLDETYLRQALQDVGVSARREGLRDVSGPQATILIATRRLLLRDARSSGETPAILNLERILHECLTRKRYTANQLEKAFGELLEAGWLRPSSDHCEGGGPFQYRLQLPRKSLLRMLPLECTIDLHKEFGAVGEATGCSTELREWGREFFRSS